MEKNAPEESTSMFAPNWRSWLWIATVSGWDWESVKISATSMSFQVHRNWKIASEAIAGPPSGMITVAKMRSSPAPSIRAASSSSPGIWVKKLRSRKIANGSPNPVWNSTTRNTVPKMPRSPNSRASGISATWIGTASSTITTTSSQSRPGKVNQANAYPARAPITTTAAVAGTAIITVFHSDPVIVGLASRFW